MDELTPAVVEHAEDAYQAIRAINHLPVRAVPAPLLYEVLGNLKNVGHALPQALNQLSRGLAVSLTEYEVYNDDGTDPARSVAHARACLTEAAAKAADVGRLLEAAQSAINRQGYHPPTEPQQPVLRQPPPARRQHKKPGERLSRGGPAAAW